jgi:hypothetical protein
VVSFIPLPLNPWRKLRRNPRLGVPKTATFSEISIDHRLTYLKYSSVACLKDGKIDNDLCGTAIDVEGNTVTKTRKHLILNLLKKKK